MRFFFVTDSGGCRESHPGARWLGDPVRSAKRVVRSPLFPGARWMKRCLWVFVIAAWSCASRADEGAMGAEPVDMSPQAVCAFYAERDCAAWLKCNAPEVRYFFGDLATCKER